MQNDGACSEETGAEIQRQGRNRFIDVRKERELARSKGIRAIPTQVFYDKEGKEVLRHEGYMDRQTIIDVLTRLGTG